MIRFPNLRLFTPLAALLSLLVGLCTAPAWAQDSWPARPIRMVVPFPPGGSSDILGRIVADRLGRMLNANVFVDNKPGGTTQIGTDFVANAAPDGYTLLLGAASSFTVLPNLRKLSYSMDSFEAVGGVADYIAVMAVRKTLPVKDMKEFVAYAKAHPKKLSFGSAGEASAGHVYGGTLSRDTGIELLHVPFRGSVDAVNALVAGDIDFVIDGAATPMVKAGRAVPLATFYRVRHPELPNVPTLKEAGFDIATSKGAGWGVLAPRGTPKAVMARLSEALRKILADKSVQEEFLRANSIASWQTPEEFRLGLQADQKMYSELLPAIGVSKSQ
ncbi:Bug family tripartite tricarboxylate transporter substrate binding protein [Variovorax terrae]|uniref:Tripartite tricarboxylate transporter substrate binding protein n=1 Tax=Variovorax terrae TaxID=2923278 RepID=A0A9X2ALC6_9BURK|nr:tripartite tricarboxylate transporter substrate binding protein [Variovorax terrae]MCJ0762573.1 tripartite tricarboxylate transporter substrate binding protein [Variovorax terrae]